MASKRALAGALRASALIPVTVATVLVAPAPASAQTLPSITLPDTGIEAVDQTVAGVSEQLGTGEPAPQPPEGAGTPAPSPSGSAPGNATSSTTSTPPPVPQPGTMGGSPVAPADGVAPQAAGSPVPARQGGQGGEQPAQAPVEFVSDAATAAGQRAAGPPPEPVTEEAKPESVLERVVQIIPMPLKLALGALVILLLTAILGVGKAHRRLAASERRAATDALTGLPNRRHADEVLERLLAAARRNRRPLAVILFDLDHFKKINDNLGHAAGDVALQATAAASRELLRGSDYVARFGGEEFLLLLPETGSPDALLVAEKLRLRLSVLEVSELKDHRVTASFGVAIYPEHGVGADELLAEADAALYRAKSLGRDRVEAADALLDTAETELAAA